ncbi:MAG: hypothetical protein ACXABF_16210 [Candidatus Thorarchaeota archaeon]|jgi:hypothetical protein
MKKLLIIILATFLGCSWSAPIGDNTSYLLPNIFPVAADSVCTTLKEGEQSLICSYFRRPETVDSLLYIADAAFLTKFPDKAGEMINLINSLQFMLTSPSLTYGALFLAVKEIEGSLLGMAVANEIGVFNDVPDFISDFDKELISYHLAKVKTLAAIAAGN